MTVMTEQQIANARLLTLRAISVKLKSVIKLYNLSNFFTERNAINPFPQCFDGRW